ncbi:MAG: TIR domain-containing protein [Pseudomonadota bacterium]
MRSEHRHQRGANPCPDDRIASRAATHAVLRGNVVFELGLFMGRVGRDPRIDRA